MGALCGKESSDPFSTPGRTLASSPPQTTSSVPAQPKVGGPPRTLGSSSAPNPPGADRPSNKAGDAALKRIQESRKPTGKLGENLMKDKAKSWNQVRGEAAQQNYKQKQMDQLKDETYSN